MGMNRLNPDVTFDCLFLANRLQTEEGTFATQEIHLLAYLACLLWLYRQQTVTDWGYSFVGTELGAPFSKEVDAALKELIERSHIRRIEHRDTLTDLARERLNELSSHAINQERIEFLEAASASIAVFSIGMVSNALANEPELRRSRAVPSSRPLLEEIGRTQIYSHFQALRNALGQRGPDLRLPAIVWLSALYQLNETVP
jgi:hypothetical protein